jgi:hypothetical protein
MYSQAEYEQEKNVLQFLKDFFKYTKKFEGRVYNKHLANAINKKYPGNGEFMATLKEDKLILDPKGLPEITLYIQTSRYDTEHLYNNNTCYTEGAEKRMKAWEEYLSSKDNEKYELMLNRKKEIEEEILRLNEAMNQFRNNKEYYYILDYQFQK